VRSYFIKTDQAAAWKKSVLYAKQRDSNWKAVNYV